MLALLSRECFPKIKSTKETSPGHASSSRKTFELHGGSAG